jgi:hypothetical protein
MILQSIYWVQTRPYYETVIFANHLIFWYLHSDQKLLLIVHYEGESNENRKIFLKFNLLNESGTQLYHFST